jgi:hypothetical protein
MKLRWLTVVFLIVPFLGCVSEGRNLKPGVHDAPAVRAEMGAPAEVLGLPGGGEVWFYPYGRSGRLTYRVELGPDGKLRSVEQVLYEQNFDRIIDGKTTREELRRMLGPPNHEWLAMNGWETIWDYSYWWAQQPWVLHVGIDQNGVVTSQFRRTEMGNGGSRPGM